MADNNIDSDICDCVDRLTPSFFAGARRKRRQVTPRFFRDVIFGQPDILTGHDRAHWYEIQDNNPDFVPPVVCPCDDYDFINTTEHYEEKEAKFPYMQLAASVGCDFIYRNGPGEDCDGQGRTLGEAIENQFIKEQMHVEKAFDNIEELWAAEMAITGRIKISAPGIKEYYLESKRCPTLEENLQADDCWGKNKCGNPLDDIEMMNDRMFCKEDGGNLTSHVIMSQETCNAMLASPDLVDCFKNGYNPRLQFPQLVDQGAANQEPMIPFRGARLKFNLDIGGSSLQIWCVNAYFNFYDPVNNCKVKKNLLPFGKVIGFDLSNAENAYGGRYMYGAIQNMNAGRNRAMKRYSRAYIPDHGKNMKFTTESAPMPIVYCPNASWCLNACSDKE